MAAASIHTPVLLQEVLDTLVLPPGARILDLTLGLGGHAEALLRRCDGDSRYMGVDRDPEARALAQARLGQDPRLTVISSTYEDLWRQPEYQQWVARTAPEGFDAILADLGVSSLQLKSAARGFSFRESGPLDMRMDTSGGMTAYEWIQRQDEGTLAYALRAYGEERLAKPIARSILAALREGRLATTLDLAEAVYKVIPREPAKRKGHADPATRTFQAIRIAVNGELERLASALESAVEALRPGGRLAVISFHSLEDRIVKQTFRRLAGIYDGPGRFAPEPLPKLVKLIHPGGLAPSDAELAANPPSRSARLRAAERLSQ
ncbi:MAG TPA: 16S rRNA (cytosine(1402)-N(4))-methyltransferase RsmH [Holophagaceae bacterium]|nr:16S rRNA (cytosine(1402)-N(4))-methyltransferase RsmH [Holophagaceae bacterium]